MLINISNLSLHTNDSDLTELLRTKCGITDMVLGKLELEAGGQSAKVTVGVMEEADAALIVRKINGFTFKGRTLYVENKKQNKDGEQPYRPKPEIQKRFSDLYAAAVAQKAQRALANSAQNLNQVNVPPVAATNQAPQNPNWVLEQQALTPQTGAPPIRPPMAAPTPAPAPVPNPIAAVELQSNIEEFYEPPQFDQAPLQLNQPSQPFNRVPQLFNLPPQHLNQPPPRFNQPPQPFNQPPQLLNQPFNRPPWRFDQPPLRFDQPPLRFDQPPRRFDQPPQEFNQPHPGFHQPHPGFHQPHPRFIQQQPSWNSDNNFPAVSGQQMISGPDPNPANIAVQNKQNNSIRPQFHQGPSKTVQEVQNNPNIVVIVPENNLKNPYKNIVPNIKPQQGPSKTVQEVQNNPNIVVIAPENNSKNPYKNIVTNIKPQQGPSKTVQEVQNNPNIVVIAPENNSKNPYKNIVTNIKPQQGPSKTVQEVQNNPNIVVIAPENNSKNPYKNIVPNIKPQQGPSKTVQEVQNNPNIIAPENNSKNPYKNIVPNIKPQQGPSKTVQEVQNNPNIVVIAPENNSKNPYKNIQPQLDNSNQESPPNKKPRLDNPSQNDSPNKNPSSDVLQSSDDSPPQTNQPKAGFGDDRSVAIAIQLNENTKKMVKITIKRLKNIREIPKFPKNYFDKLKSLLHANIKERIAKITKNVPFIPFTKMFVKYRRLYPETGDIGMVRKAITYLNSRAEEPTFEDDIIKELGIDFSSSAQTQTSQPKALTDKSYSKDFNKAFKKSTGTLLAYTLKNLDILGKTPDIDKDYYDDLKTAIRKIISERVTKIMVNIPSLTVRQVFIKYRMLYPDATNKEMVENVKKMMKPNKNEEEPTIEDDDIVNETKIVENFDSEEAIKIRVNENTDFLMIYTSMQLQKMRGWDQSISKAQYSLVRKNMRAKVKERVENIIKSDPALTTEGLQILYKSMYPCMEYGELYEQAKKMVLSMAKEEPTIEDDDIVNETKIVDNFDSEEAIKIRVNENTDFLMIYTSMQLQKMRGWDQSISKAQYSLVRKNMRAKVKERVENIIKSDPALATEGLQILYKSMYPCMEYGELYEQAKKMVLSIAKEEPTIEDDDIVNETKIVDNFDSEEAIKIRVNENTDLLMMYTLMQLHKILGWDQSISKAQYSLVRQAMRTKVKERVENIIKSDPALANEDLQLLYKSMYPCMEYMELYEQAKKMVLSITEGANTKKLDPQNPQIGDNDVFSSALAQNIERSDQNDKNFSKGLKKHINGLCAYTLRNLDILGKTPDIDRDYYNYLKNAINMVISERVTKIVGEDESIPSIELMSKYRSLYPDDTNEEMVENVKQMMEQNKNEVSICMLEKRLKNLIPFKLDSKTEKHVVAEIKTIIDIVRREHNKFWEEFKPMFKFRKQKFLKYITRYLKFALSRRITDKGIKTVRVNGCPKLPEKDDLEKFLANYNCVGVEIRNNEPFYTALFENYKSVDDLVELNRVTIGSCGNETIVEFQYMNEIPFQPESKWNQLHKYHNFPMDTHDNNEVNLLDKNWPQQLGIDCISLQPCPGEVDKNNENTIETNEKTIENIEKTIESNENTVKNIEQIIENTIKNNENAIENNEKTIVSKDILHPLLENLQLVVSNISNTSNYELLNKLQQTVSEIAQWTANLSRNVKKEPTEPTNEFNQNEQVQVKSEKVDAEEKEIYLSMTHVKHEMMDLTDDTDDYISANTKNNTGTENPEEQSTYNIHFAKKPIKVENFMNESNSMDTDENNQYVSTPFNNGSIDTKENISCNEPVNKNHSIIDEDAKTHGVMPNKNDTNDEREKCQNDSSSNKDDTIVTNERVQVEIAAANNDDIDKNKNVQAMESNKCVSDDNIENPENRVSYMDDSIDKNYTIQDGMSQCDKDAIETINDKINDGTGPNKTDTIEANEDIQEFIASNGDKNEECQDTK